MKSLAPGVFLLLFSTLCFYLPATLFSLKGFDMSLVPKTFYQYYSWMMAGALCLNIAYAGFLFYLIDPGNLYLKIPVCWLVVAEIYTLVYHVINKILLLNASSDIGKVLTLAVFAGCSIFFFYRAIKKPSSEKFDPTKTFVIRYLPKDMPGVFNYLWDHAGHKALYQDGKIYKFEKDTGFVESKKATYEYFEKDNISIVEIPKIKDIDNLIGGKFHLRKFNCNHLINYATSKS